MPLALVLGIGIWAVSFSVLGVLAVIVAIAAIVSVLRNAELSGGTKAGWLVAIVLFPLLGGIVYFAVRSDW